MKNDVEIDHSRDLATPRLCFLFFLLLLFYFSQFPSLLNAGTPSSVSPSRLFIEKGALGTMAARPGELRLSPEVTGSPRRAGSFTLKSFGDPGEPEASLGELGSRKVNEKTLLPLLFGIFRILDQNIERSFVLCGN